MAGKELRKLSRRELLEILVAQSEELELCKQALSEAQRELEKREIAITNAGSIAEASLALSGIFEAAQDACQQYTENIRLLSERQERLCLQMEQESRMNAAKIVEEAKQQREMIEHEARIRATRILRSAKREAEKISEEYFSETGVR